MCAATCRAVGWSNINVLDNVKPSPTARCNWLRSSTAPSESTPASMSGASASTAPPAVCFTNSSTEASDTMLREATTATTAVAASSAVDFGAISDRKAGTLPMLSIRCHCTGITPIGEAACGSTAACIAPSPCARPIRPKPAAASIAIMRSFAAPCAAMPTSAHAPHCTLTEARPWTRRDEASASSHVFAAL